MKPWKTGLVIVIALLFGAVLAHAQEEAPSTTTPAPAEEPATTAAEEPATEEAKTEKEKREKKPVTYRAKRGRLNFGTGIHELSDNVVFTQEETTLYCDEAVYNEDDSTAKATGNLKLVHEDTTTITGDVIDADFDKELAIITGNVTLVTQKKSEEAEDESEKDKEWRKKTTLTCEKIEYYYGEGRAVATDDLKIVHEDKTVTGDVGVYLENDEIATITGNVKLIDDEGRTMECEKATVSTAEDWAEFEGVSGVWWKTEEEEEEPEETQPPAETEPEPASESPAEGEAEPEAATPPEAEAPTEAPPAAEGQ